jgi:two-component system, chemotaxis family, CheB/CheR fusion protein
VSDEAESSTPSPAEAAAPPSDEPGFASLLEYLHRSRGFDFGGYKQSSLARRVQRRMQLVNIATYAEYTDYLEVHPDEFPQLFNIVLINVTAFFRDPTAWESLAGHLPKLIAARPSDGQIRAWTAGCASGEEAFTLAMILAEELGLEAFSRRVKIYATDVDDEALAHARQATYGAKAIESVPSALVEKYFARTGSAYVFNKELRRAVIFGRHDLVQDAPISRVDILTCRNTLMYFNSETQTRILKRLNFALNDDALLFLGKAEMLLTHGNLFTPVDLKLRIFTRSPRSTKARERVALDLPPPHHAGHAGAEHTISQDKAERTRLRQSVFDTSPNAIIVVDAQGRLALMNNQACSTFKLLARDVGRPFQDLELSYRPVELRSYIDLVRAEKHTKQLRQVECPSGNEVTFFDVTFTPIFGDNLEVSAVQVAFVDVTRHHRLEGELRKANAELETAHEELQSTSEELETTNEELQSTVEELETTNEELQSTNEELETMNEELQSTNEELQTLNEELRKRGIELNQVSSFFGAILASLHAGVAVLDPELRVQVWNLQMEELWGVRADEVDGKHFMNLDIGLPVTDLVASIRSCLHGDGEIEKTVECTNRRGKRLACKVFITRLAGTESAGVIILIEEQVPR